MIHRSILVASLVCIIAIPVRAQVAGQGDANMLAPGIQTTQPTMPVVDDDRTVVGRAELARRVDYSIRKGVKFLLSRQAGDGSWNWEEDSGSNAGYTALVTLALLSCGESHQSPAIARAVAYLKRAHPERERNATYSIGLRASVYSLLPEPMRRDELRADLRWLQQAIIKAGPVRGMYDYGSSTVRGGDYSNSQYGVLGVWYSEAAGLEVPRSYWQAVENGWLNGQLQDGGWGYKPGYPYSYGSMTAAAVATLFITNDNLHASAAQDLSKTVENKPLERAMDWLAANFDVSQNPGRARNRRPRNNADIFDLMGELAEEPGYQVHYMLFGFERAGEASGRTRFGEHKWYEAGAQWLLRTQSYEGSWTGSIGSEGDTAYSLLFLSRGRAPVVIQKLQFDGRWDNRSRDAAAFVRFMRRATERHVNWQIVSIDDSLAQLREAPLLYIASDRALELTDEQKLKLKTYVEEGGLLVCVNEGAGGQFAQSIVSLGHDLFPNYAFRDVPADHMIYNANFPAPRGEKIQSLGNQVREMIVLYPTGDMSWKWLEAAGGFLPRNSAYATLANTWLYATDRANPRFKGEDSWVDRNDGTIANRSMLIARIRHDGNWNPEPAGWVRLANVMHNFDSCDIGLEVIGSPRGQSADAPTTQPITLDAKRHLLAHLTSTESVQLSPDMKRSLRKYLDDGGLLLMDAAGGSPEAGGSFDLLLRELYPTCVFGNVKLNHGIYNAVPYGGQDATHVDYRRSTTLEPTHTPRLRAAVADGKLIAILSSDDLSAGLVGYTTAGILGYAPQSATDLMRNIILWRGSALR